MSSSTNVLLLYRTNIVILLTHFKNIFLKNNPQDYQNITDNDNKAWNVNTVPLHIILLLYKTNIVIIFTHFEIIFLLINPQDYRNITDNNVWNETVLFHICFATVQD